MPFPLKFPGGVHPHEGVHGKEATRHKPTVVAQVPDRVILPLSQHIGAACECLLQKGDTVALGQPIGCAKGRVSAPVHASVSGRVVDIAPCMLVNGISVPSVVIDNDHEDRWDPSIRPDPDVETRTPEELVDRIRGAGIVGLGGATFPTAVKLSIPEGKSVDTLILNGAECEPYLTADHRLMLERPDEVLDGLALGMKILSVQKAFIGIEDNKPDALELLRSKAPANVQVVSLPTRYPQGGEKQLIYALTGRRVPKGGLPMDVGVVVLNVATAAAISRSLRTGRPLIERIITVAGRVANPQNLLVRIGTPLNTLVEQCGGLTEGVEKLVLGGPMMGIALSRLEIPMVKSYSGLLALGKESIAPEENPCIRCGRCAEACPMLLPPMRMDAFIRKRMCAEAEKEGLFSCIECGACSYVCPAKRQLAQMFRVGKYMLYQERKKKA
ncbi:MAG TPA: electron transport complex subunit RsxC [Clostridia bacterium]|nr:electron transport complex subunit RsxC [Clostridia bacterium]